MMEEQIVVSLRNNLYKYITLTAAAHTDAKDKTAVMSIFCQYGIVLILNTAYASPMSVNV